MDSRALFQRIQLHGAGTHHLEDDGNRTGLAVETGDGQGNALGIFLRADNDELTGLCLLCDQRCFDPKLGNSGVQLSPFYDSKQSSLSLPYWYVCIVTYSRKIVKRQQIRNLCKD